MGIFEDMDKAIAEFLAAADDFIKIAAADDFIKTEKDKGEEQ